jgi:hypothetical protein
MSLDPTLFMNTIEDILGQPMVKITGDAGDVTARFDQVAAFADALGASTMGWLDSLKNSFLSGLEMPTFVHPEAPDINSLPTVAAGAPNYPIIDPIIIPAVDFPYSIPTIPPITITTDPPPEFTGTQPPITIPPAPTVPFPTFTESPPQISTPTLPNPPSYSLPPIPILDDISVPGPPEFNIPPWEGTPPNRDLTPPEPMFVWSELEYDSALKNIVASRLATDIVNGGTGIDPAWEAAFLARRRNDLAEKHEQMMIEVENRWAGRGFTMPPGALAGQLLEIQKQVLRDEENLQNDIIIKQEELAHEYAKFCLDTATAWEKNQMDYMNQYQNRAFEAAKFQVESALIIYQALVEAYKAELEAYKVEATVYEARIRAEIGKAELYKAQIEGVKVNVDVKQAQIEAYKAQIMGIQQLVELYKAEMQGAQIQAEVDRTRIESFKALVQAYAANVEAIKARYEAYQAQIEGEAAKVKIWEAEAQAYEAVVRGYAAKANVDVARAEAQLKISLAEVDVFKALVGKFEADVSYAMKNIDAQLGIERLDVDMFGEDTKRYLGELDYAARKLMAQAEVLKAQAMGAQADATVQAAEARASATAEAAAAEAGARTAAATISSAYAGISHTTSYGFREVVSDNQSRVNSHNSTGQAIGAVGDYTYTNRQE